MTQSFLVPVKSDAKQWWKLAGFVSPAKDFWVLIGISGMNFGVQGSRQDFCQNSQMSGLFS